MSGTGEGGRSVTTGRREELLAAAREVLAANGYERTTVSSIASKANVAQGTFYLYFESKEALPGALALEFSTALADAARAAVDGVEDLDAAIDALITATWAAADEHRDIIMIANRGVELADSFENFLAYTAPLRSVLEEFLRTHQRSGRIEPTLDPTTTAYVLRDLLDRSIKAKLCFGQDGWAQQTSVLVRRALAA